MPGLEQAVKAQDVGRVDKARAHLTSRCGGWCLGRKSDEARRQCTWIRSRKQVLSSKVSMICCLWLVLILADQGSAESLVLMAGLNVVQVLEYYCCTYLLILTCRATYIRPYKPHLDGRSLSGLKQTTLLKLNIHHLTLIQIKEVQRYKEHHSSLIWCTFIR